MTVRSKLLSLVVLSILAAGALAAGLLWWPKPPVALASGTLLSPARALADFSLIDTAGRSFGSENLRGHWSLMFFGYTNCPDFCPTTLTTLAALNGRLRREHAEVPQVLFVSVDAKRDTPAQLDKYVPYFDPAFVGLTSQSQSTTEGFARTLGVAVALQPPDADGNYVVDHSAQVFVFDPAGKLAAVLSGPFTVDALRSDWRRITAGPA